MQVQGSKSRKGKYVCKERAGRGQRHMCMFHVEEVSSLGKREERSSLPARASLHHSRGTSKAKQPPKCLLLPVSITIREMFCSILKWNIHTKVACTSHALHLKARQSSGSDQRRRGDEAKCQVKSLTTDLRMDEAAGCMPAGEGIKKYRR